MSKISGVICSKDTQNLLSQSYLQAWQKINGQTAKFAEKYHFLGIRKVLNLGLKAEKPVKNENHTEDWVLGSHPRDNGHVTH